MKKRLSIRGLHFGSHFHYTKNDRSKGVRKMNKRLDLQNLLKVVTITVLATIFMVIGVGKIEIAYAQDESVVEDFFTLMASLPDPFFCTLPDLLEALDSAASEDREPLLIDTRVYLEGEDITIEDEYHEIIVIDTSVVLNADDPWFNFSEPRGPEEEIGFLPQCVGFAFENVVFIIQQAVPLSDLESRDPRGINPYIHVIASLSGKALNKLHEEMASLNRAPLGSQKRVDFLRNPREWALDKGVLLSADLYRIGVFDLEKAIVQMEQMGLEPPTVAFKRSPAREGLAVRAECGCLLYKELCFVIQEAL